MPSPAGQDWAGDPQLVHPCAAAALPAVRPALPSLLWAQWGPIHTSLAPWRL